MFDVVGKTLYHNSTHFTQGLTYSRISDTLFESCGLFRKSKICKLNATTGLIVKCRNMKPKYFAEGMQVYGNEKEEKLIQITWLSNTGFIYDADSLDIIKQFEFKTGRNEGWGICLNELENEFIVSDGSAFLYFWDVDSLKEKRNIEVTRQNGLPAVNINELEFMDGKVLANVWQEDILLVINPQTGECEMEYDFSFLWPLGERTQRANVLNGISVSNEDGIILMTGKLWDRMYKVKLKKLQTNRMLS